MALRVLQHPLAAHLVSQLRSVDTTPEVFRGVTVKLTTLLVLEATGAVRIEDCQVTTPLETTTGRVLAQGIAAIPVLRAGLGMIEPVLQLFPDVAVGYIGLERHHETAIAHSYYSKLPLLQRRFTLCLDPMLATGGSASQALSLIKGHGGDPIVMVCVVAAPEGIARLRADHPDVDVVAAVVDRELNDQKYILPGLGDFGDRLYGTL